MGVGTAKILRNGRGGEGKEEQEGRWMGGKLFWEGGDSRVKKAKGIPGQGRRSEMKAMSDKLSVGVHFGWTQEYVRGPRVKYTETMSHERLGKDMGTLEVLEQWMARPMLTFVRRNRAVERWRWLQGAVLRVWQEKTTRCRRLRG